MGKALVLHFILRYADKLRGADTIEEHLAIQKEFGEVWWGKFGLGASKQIVETAKRQIDSGKTTYVYLTSGASIKYRAKLIDIIGGDAKTQVRPLDTDRIPSYYRSESLPVWFKLTGINPATGKQKSNLVLYNRPSCEPALNGMRGLIYVAHGKAAPKSESANESLQPRERDIFDEEF